MKNSKEVYISYAWGGESESFVDQLDQVFQKQEINIIRDKRNLGYKGLIKEFMQTIGQGKCVIAVISDKYLKSSNCMFELVQVAKNGKFFDRIFPVLLADAQIYDPLQRLKYVKHWEDKKNELNEAIKEVGAEYLQGLREDIDNYTEIRNTIAELTNILKNMNTLTPSIHSKSDFEELIKAVQLSLQVPDSSNVIFLDDFELISECGINYDKLQNLLQNKRWNAANQETTKLILQASGRALLGPQDCPEAIGTLGDRDIKSLPCQDLHTINRLWKKYSNDRFGFSIQLGIFREEKDWDKFQECVGWKSKYSTDDLDLIFDLSAPAGHLPTPPRHYFVGSLYHNVATIIHRFQQCSS